jgi:hypothetical protein
MLDSLLRRRQLARGLIVVLAFVLLAVVAVALEYISSNKRVETVTALPPRPRTNGAMQSTCTWPIPSVSATGSGANACAQSTWPRER